MFIFLPTVSFAIYGVEIFVGVIFILVFLFSEVL